MSKELFMAVQKAFRDGKNTEEQILKEAEACKEKEPNLENLEEDSAHFKWVNDPETAWEIYNTPNIHDPNLQWSLISAFFDKGLTREDCINCFTNCGLFLEDGSKIEIKWNKNGFDLLKDGNKWF